MRYLIPALLLFSTLPAQAQIFGSWEGKPVNLELRIGFKFEQRPDGSVSGKMDSPDQNAFDIKMDTTIITGDSVFTEFRQAGFSFEGKLVNDTTLSGMISQGVKLPLVLHRKSASSAKAQKPQTPVPPFPYNSEDVLFPGGADGVTIGGTITYPKSPGSPGKYPALLLIGGSGPSDRDHTIFGHKPFAVIADHLSRKGFLVLRVDDRGIGRSTGSYMNSTSADFSKDANAAIEYLRTRPEVNTSRIGILGHSEGGMIAPMVAAERNDIAFIVLLAAPGIEVKELMREQASAVFAKTGADEETANAFGKLYKGVIEKILDSDDSTKAIKKGTDYAQDWAKKMSADALAKTGLSSAEQRKSYVFEIYKALSDPWFRYFIQYDPGKTLKKLNTKVLAINGEEDVQVLSTSNLEGIKQSLSKSKSPAPFIISLPGHNHLFQKCTTCSVTEYGQLEESFSREALELITEWLLKNS